MTAPAPQPTPKVKPINLVTERFMLRTLRAEDVTRRFRDWLADPEVMMPLNRRPAKISREQLVRTIASFDGTREYEVGIFLRESAKHIGIYHISHDRTNRTATFNVVIGDKTYWGEKVVLETRPVLLDHFFLERGIEKAIGRPPARNFPSVFNYKVEGWRLEGVLIGQLKSEFEDKQLDQYQFGLMKDEWLAMRRRKQDDADA